MKPTRLAIAAILWAACAVQGALAATADVSTRAAHSLAIDINGGVYAWGSDARGQLGTGRTLQLTSPAPVTGIPAMASVAAGARHVLAIDASGNVWAWGSNDFGQLGLRQQPIGSKPARVLGIAGAVQVAGGQTFSAALRSDGTVWAWGVGPGATSPRPVRIDGLAGITRIAAGTGTGGHLLALRSDATVWALGANSFGQVGDGTQAYRATPVQVAAGVADIAAGATQSLAITTGGTVLAWGSNAPHGTPRLVPAAVAGPANVVAIAAAQTSFAVIGDGSVVSWDDNYAPAAYPGAPAPSPYAGIQRLAVGEAVAGFTTYGLDASGALFTHGANGRGQRGVGSTATVVPVTAVPGLAGLTHIAAGLSFAAARRGDGTVFAWGSNEDGTLADLAIPVRSHPVPVTGLPSDIVTIKAGAEHSLALDSSGQAWAWGRNDSGQLGSQYPTPASTPMPVPGLSNITAIAAGCTHSLFLRNDGTVWFVGRMTPQLTNTLSPTQVPGMASDIVAIASGCQSAFAVRSNGQFYAWGDNADGQLGDGTTATRAAPVLVTSVPGVAAIDITDQHAVARTTGGAVWTWGENNDGQLGDGTDTDRVSPVQVAGISTAVQVAAGSRFSLALLADGTIRSWGRNVYGTLGDGTRVDRFTPVTVAVPIFPAEPGLAILRIAAGAFPLAVRDGGTAWGWGRGLTGDGTFATRTRPTLVLREGAGGNLDGSGATEWFLDLDPPAADRVPPAAIVRVVPVVTVTGEGNTVALTAGINFRSADYGKNVGTYILGVVPPAFLTQVELAPAMSKALVESLQQKAGEVLVQLTPQGWMTVTGQLVAYTSGVINGNGGANNILNGVPLTSIPGAQFCIGYGDSASSMLSTEALREVLSVEGATATASGLPCVLAGMYVSGPPSSNAGTQASFTAMVVGLSPTGSVQLRDEAAGFQGNLGGPLALTPQNEALATASFATSSLAPGVHSIGGNYSGDGQNAAASVANPLLHVVAPVAAGTSVSLAGPASSTQGQSVSFTATVFGNGPTGLVQFKDGAADLGGPVALFNGAATLAVGTLSVGAHSITAVYAGDGNNTGSTSNAVGHTVYVAVPTEIALVPSANPATSGALVTLTATVTGNGPTGSVTFRDGGAPFATVALAGGTAAVSTTAFAPGVHSVTADYGGDGGNPAVSSATLFLQVTAPPPPAPTTTALAASANPSTLAQPVTFTATISGIGGASGGTVLFRDGFDAITGCSAVPVTSGTAACATNGLAAGTHTLTAVYSGMSGFEGSTSAGLSQTVNAGTQLLSANPPSLAFGGQSMNTTSAAQSATITNTSGVPVTVTAVSAPTGFSVVTHDCATLAVAATCTVTIAFTPPVEGSAGGLVAVSYAGAGPTTIAVTGTGEKSLVTHYYASILRRPPDAPGKAFWESEAVRMQSIGANVNETWFSMASFFYFSAEYLAFNRNDAEFVTDLYNTFFNRGPDGPGLAFWSEQIASGMPREVVLAAFMFSGEFATFTQAIFGNTAARAEVDVVLDFYRGLLARLPDQGGFDFWVAQFRAAQCAGAGAAGAVYTQVESISSSFATGGEYLGKNRTNAQYVGDLYNSFLRRGGDLGGVSFWIGQLDSAAMTRELVRQQFIASAEFTGRVNAIIAQGCL